MDLVVECFGEKRPLTGIGNLLDLFKDLTPVMDALGFSGREDVLMHLKSQTDIYGRPFEPSWRARATGGETLRDTGALRSSINYFANSVGVTWGSAKGYGADKYAALHNFGGVIRPKGKKFLRFKVANKWVMRTQVVMPRRRYIGIEPHDMAEMHDVIMQVFNETVNR